jgi:hypothetical protein
MPEQNRLQFSRVKRSFRPLPTLWKAVFSQRRSQNVEQPIQISKPPPISRFESETPYRFLLLPPLAPPDGSKLNGTARPGRSLSVNVRITP